MFVRKIKYSGAFCQGDCINPVATKKRRRELGAVFCSPINVGADQGFTGYKPAASPTQRIASSSASCCFGNISRVFL